MCSQSLTEQNQSNFTSLCGVVQLQCGIIPKRKRKRKKESCLQNIQVCLKACLGPCFLLPVCPMSTLGCSQVLSGMAGKTSHEVVRIGPEITPLLFWWNYFPPINSCKQSHDSLAFCVCLCLFK